MKKISNIFKLTLFSLLLIACSAEEPAELDGSLGGDNTPPPPPPVSDGTMTAKIDGTDFTELELVTARLTNDGATGDKIVITGKKGTEVITLKMPLSITPNNVNTPYALGNASTNYEATYNTNNTTVFSAAENGGVHVTFDDNLWVADDPTASVVGGVTTLNAERDNGGEIFEFVINSTDVVSHQFGPTANNTASYFVSNGGGAVYNTLNDADNGNFTLTKLDTDNKLISGTFNFDGRTYFTPNIVTPTGPDTDGDGMLDTVEIDLGYDINDANSPIQPEGYTGYDNMNAIWLAADGDNDGITNEDELLGPDGDINTPGDATDPYEGNADGDGDGISDDQEVLDNTDAANPCDPAQAVGYTGYDATNTTWQNADCDGDGVSNNDELTDGDANTYPYFVEYEDKSFTTGSFNNITYTGGGVVRWGLNIASHNGNHIVGSFRFITASIGTDPVTSQVITDGTFDVVYTTD